MNDGTLPAESLLRDALDAILHRVHTTLKDAGEAFPLYADPETGTWGTTSDGNWCAGHWINLLRLAATYADSDQKAERFKTAARSHTATLESSGIRDTMFGGMNYLYAGFRGWDLTDDRSLFGLGLEGADAMQSLFHEPTQLVPRRESEYAIARPDYEPTDATIQNDAGLSTKLEASSDNIYTCIRGCDGRTRKSVIRCSVMLRPIPTIRNLSPSSSISRRRPRNSYNSRRPVSLMMAASTVSVPVSRTVSMDSLTLARSSSTNNSMILSSASSLGHTQ